MAKTLIDKVGTSLIDKVGTLLKEEKWTGTAIGEYTVKNFEDWDALIQEVNESGIQEEVQELCDEHLEKAKNSITSLYIRGILALQKQRIDDSRLMELINTFSGQQRWNVVEHICQAILRLGENKMALRVLADCYSKEGREDEIEPIWKRLVRIDLEEADILKTLGERKEAQNEPEKATIYYKKAIHRYLNKGHYSQVREVWLKLCEINIHDLEFFLSTERKIAKAMGVEQTTPLLEALYPAVEKQGEWKKAIQILKLILHYDPKSLRAREDIIKNYRKLYEGHSLLEEYIKASDLTQNWRSATGAITEFEKHIVFDKGNFVYHKTWGVGVIKNIREKDITIDFSEKRGHTMSLKMGLEALLGLEKDHIWVLKSVYPKAKLKEKIKKDIPWALKIIIRSFDNAADMKRIKAELVPAILSPGEWPNWSSEAKRTLNTNSEFGNMPDEADLFIVRDNPISFEEKTFNRFKAEDNFFTRYRIVQEFLQEAEDSDTDYLVEMFSYFMAFLKASHVNEQVVCSYLFVNKIAKDYPHLNPGLNYGFKELFEDIDNLEELFTKIEAPDLKSDFLTGIKQNIENWETYYIQLFPYYLNKSLLEELRRKGFENLVADKLNDIMINFREYREAFVWMARTLAEESWFKSLGIPQERIFINLLHLMDISFREIANKKNITENKKLNRSIQTHLFKEKRLISFILTEEEATAGRLFSVLNDVKELDVKLKLPIRQGIKEKYPHMKLPGEENESSPLGLSSTTSILTLEASLLEKKRELKHILDVEVPLNSREIGEAIEMGDLKENAEYKASKEKQEALNIQVGKLKEGIERAKVFDPKALSTKTVSFGTTVALSNLLEESEESYTILGPWESDPSNNVISYMSPFGAALVGKKKGEKIQFTINEKDYSYKILKVEKAALT